MLRALLLGFGLLLPVQAQALSCLPWHVEDAFLEADASADTYVIVTGTLDFAAEELPQVEWERQSEVPPETRLEARLHGALMGRAEQSTPFDEAIELVVECAGPWCPQLAPGTSYLAFVDISQTPYLLRTGACGGMAFQDPDEDMLRRVRTCLDGGGCTPPER